MILMDGVVVSLTIAHLAVPNIQRHACSPRRKVKKKKKKKGLHYVSNIVCTKKTSLPTSGTYKGTKGNRKKTNMWIREVRRRKTGITESSINYRDRNRIMNRSIMAASWILFILRWRHHFHFSIDWSPRWTPT